MLDVNVCREQEMLSSLMYVMLGAWLMYDGVLAGKGSGADLGDVCVEDFECYMEHAICVGSPCDSVCACGLGYKQCNINYECIPDLADTVSVGGNCTLDTECIGAGTYCRRNNATNANGDVTGACADDVAGGRASMQRGGGGGQGGGSSAVRSTHALYVTGTLLIVMYVAGSLDDFP